MRKIILIIFLVLKSPALFAQVIDVKCASAKEYVYSHPGVSGGVVTEKIKKPIKMCWNNRELTYWVNGKKTILIAHRHDVQKSMLRPEYVEESFDIDDENGDRDLYNVTIIHSSPAQVTIRWTRGGGWAYDFFSHDIPVMKLEKKDTTAYKKPVYDSRIKYPDDNESLNPGLRQSYPLKVPNMNGKGFHRAYTTGKQTGDKEAICAIDIKKYLKKKVPYLNSSYGEITIMFEIRPDGTTKWTGGGYSLYLAKPKVKKLDKDIKAAMNKLPIWKVPDGLDYPINGFLHLQYK